MDFLDDLGLDFGIPFPGTSNAVRFPGQCFLNTALERQNELRPLMEPIRPDAPWMADLWSNDEELSDSDDEDIYPSTFHCFYSVGPDFGPDGGSANARWHYKAFKEQPATTPSLKELIIISEQGRELLRIRPRFTPRIRVTRGCVETAISEWMKMQRKLPVGDENRLEVQSRTLRYSVDDEEKRVGVWLWRGLQQDSENPNCFKIFL